MILLIYYQVFEKQSARNFSKIFGGLLPSNAPIGQVTKNDGRYAHL
jgi:hypothetical protein